MDQGVGMILAGLKRTGLYDDTLVVFLSDNGPPFINSKATLYDAGVCLPLIVRQPGGAADVVNRNMVSYVDILPTMLDWSNHPKINNVERAGRSFLRILSEPSPLPPWDHVSVRTRSTKSPTTGPHVLCEAVTINTIAALPGG
jgi:N-sulfoglucosamine sulfohydrolase